MHAATLLMNCGAFAEAAAMLRHLAVDPHNASLAEAARRLEQAERRQRARQAPEPAETTDDDGGDRLVLP